VPIEESYELTLEPIEDGTGWTAMVYRSVRAGVCGPWTETKLVAPAEPYAMFRRVDELAAAGLRALGVDKDFEPGAAEVYGRYGQIALRVSLERIERPHMLPVIGEGGDLEWVQA
jgi:hypothetical protein